METPVSNIDTKADYPVLKLDSEIVPVSPGEGSSKQPKQLAFKLQLALSVAERVFIKPFRYQFFSQVISGRGRRSDEQLRIKYIGDGSQLHYLKSLCFDGETNANAATQLSLLKLSAAMQGQQDCDLLLIDLPMPLNLLLKIPGRFTPHWLKQNIELPGDWQEFLGNLRRKTRMEAQRIIRKFELKSRIVPAEDCAAEFYRELYKPYTLERHGESTIIDDEKTFVDKARGSFIMQLMRDDKILAGSQIRQTGGSFTIGAVGMDLSLPFKEQLCLVDAMDYFALMHAVQLGCSIVDMGHSRANLNDGILRYKKKWSANIKSGVIPKGSINVKAMNASPAVLDFYSNNSLVSQQGRQLSALKLLRGDDDINKLSSALQQLEIPGLANIEVVLPQEMQAQPVELETPYQLHPYSNSEELIDLLNG
jgi:hypothetical protein